jgi:hypothetical protein
VFIFFGLRIASSFFFFSFFFLTFAHSLVIVELLSTLISEFYENVCQSSFSEPILQNICIAVVFHKVTL